MFTYLKNNISKKIIMSFIDFFIKFPIFCYLYLLFFLFSLVFSIYDTSYELETNDNLSTYISFNFLKCFLNIKFWMSKWTTRKH